MHGGEEIWEWVCASVRSSGFPFFLLRDRCKLKKRKARGAPPGLSRGVVKLTGRPARNAAESGPYSVVGPSVCPPVWRSLLGIVCYPVAARALRCLSPLNVASANTPTLEHMCSARRAHRMAHRASI